jgi:hypothetical protein
VLPHPDVTVVVEHPHRAERLPSPQYVPAVVPVYRTGPTWTAATTTLPVTGAVAVSDVWLETLQPGGVLRIDTASCTGTTDVVTDASVAAGDLGSPTAGLGIPPFSYVGTVTPGTSFLLSSSPTIMVPVNTSEATTNQKIVVGNGSFAYLLVAKAGQIFYYPE